MALVVPNAAEEVILTLLLSIAEGLDLKIFQNNYTPIESSATVDFTEATFTGYASIQLSAANWGYTQGDPTVALYNAAQTFTSTAGSQNQSCYGYYIERRTTGDVMWAERFTDGPYVIVNNGDSFSVTPRISLE